VSVTSVGITIQQAKELATQYQVRGGRQLPPGIRKQLAKGKPLPPGIANKVTQHEFLAALPQHSGHEWQICGTDLVLVAVGTALIVDILSDVF
jgi:Ni/Co efflux regulator RcnB